MSITSEQFVDRLTAAARDPVDFRKMLAIEVDGKPVRFSSSLDPWQARDFEALDPAWRQMLGRPPQGNAKRFAWLERGKGHSKTTDVAIQVLWALIAAPKGRPIKGIAAAKDEKQARLLRDAIKTIVTLNPWLAFLVLDGNRSKPFIAVYDTRVENSATGSCLEITTSDGPGSHGVLVDFIVMDEVGQYGNRALFDSFFTSAEKKQRRCIFLCITNAGILDSWQFNVRNFFKAQSDDPASEFYFARVDGLQASWLGTDFIPRQAGVLHPMEIQRYWLNEWVGNDSPAIDADDLKFSQTLKAPPQDGPGWVFVAGLDLGISHDASALVIVKKSIGWTERIELEPKPQPLSVRVAREMGLAVDDSPEYELQHHEGTGRLQVTHVEVWRPPVGGKVDLACVEKAIYDAHARYSLASVVADPWQSEYLTQRLASRGVPCDPMPFVGPNMLAMAQATLEAFRNRMIEMQPDVTLVADLRALRVTEKSYGIRLEAPRRQAEGASYSPHGDSAVALSLALAGIKRFNRPAGPPRISRPLLCWP